MQAVFRTIEQYQMIVPGCGVVTGVSGGADSVCLLYLLHEYQKKVPFRLRAVHVEHGLRGEESLQDAAYVQRICERWQIPCETAAVPVRQIAKQQGISTEEAGRLARYRIFEEQCRIYDCDRIAVAHNENDQAETVLHNLVRGSGLRGMGGIRAVRKVSDAAYGKELRIIRPLLFTARTTIEEILRERGICWQTDHTNLEREYTRNRIRLSMLPQMEKELNYQALHHIAGAGVRLQEVQDYLEQVTDRAAKTCIRCEEDGTVCIILDPFFNQEVLIRKELIKKALLEQSTGLKDIGSVHLEALLRLSEMDCGRTMDLPGGRRGVREAGLLRLSEKGNTVCAVSEIEYPIPINDSCRIGTWRIQTEILENSPELSAEIRTEKKYTKLLSYDTIKNSVLRTRRTGDYLVVNEQGGRKKLKDYLIDCKIPRENRDQILLVAEDSQIFWVAGCRIGETARVTEATKRVIRIQMEVVK